MSKTIEKTRTQELIEQIDGIDAAVKSETGNLRDAYRRRDLIGIRDVERRIEKLTADRKIVNQFIEEETKIEAAQRDERLRAERGPALDRLSGHFERDFPAVLAAIEKFCEGHRPLEDECTRVGVPVDHGIAVVNLWKISPAGAYNGAEEQTDLSQFVDRLRAAGIKLPRYTSDKAHIPNPTPWAHASR